MSGVYRSYARFVLLLLGLAALLMIPGFAVTQKLGGAGAVAAMFWGCGLTLLASAVGGLPLIVGEGSPQNAGTLALGSLAIRMGVTLLGVLAILLGTDVSRSAFLLWVAISYLSFLVVDVLFVVARSPAK